MQSTQLFSKRLEKTYLFVILPAFFLVWLAVIFGFIRPLTFNEKWDFFFAKYVALNFTHTLMSFVIILLMPEGRAWFKEDFKTKRRYLFVGVAILILIGGILKAIHGSRAAGPGKFLIKFISILLFSVHTVEQTKGLALLYNRKDELRLPSDEKAKLLRLEKIERILFSILVKAVFLQFILASMRLTSFEVNVAATCVFSTLVFAIIGIAIQQTKITRSNKSWFVTSLLFLAALPISTTATLLYRSLHGIEFGFLTHKIWSRSRIAQMTMLAYVVAAAAIIFSVGNMYERSFLSSSYLGHSAIQTLIVINFFIEYMHYFIDSRIFRFRDPLVRKHIMPLVLDASEKPAATFDQRIEPVELHGDYQKVSV